jgi:hypothetical protein
MPDPLTRFDREVAEFISEYEALALKFGMLVALDTRDLGPLKVNQYMPYVVAAGADEAEIERAILEMRVSHPLLVKK